MMMMGMMMMMMLLLMMMMMMMIIIRVSRSSLPPASARPAPAPARLPWHFDVPRHGRDVARVEAGGAPRGAGVWDRSATVGMRGPTHCGERLPLLFSHSAPQVEGYQG